jgi:PiT family inorganic phosphate transporter
MSQELLVVVALALVFDFLNGLHDSSNIVATMISSRAFRPGVALALTGAAEFVGPFVFGVAVARAVGDEIARSEALNLDVIAACLAGAILWNLFTWFFGIPSSSSHALIGGVLGAVLAAAGPGAVKVGGLYKVLIALFASPLVGFLAGFGATRLIYLAARDASPAINTFFRRAQLITAVAMAFSHGTNDAQKTMGIITLSLVISGALPAFHVPLWVIAASAAAIALGSSLGSWRLIRTLGAKFYRVRPVHSFAAQLTSAVVILSASLVGGPVSTTQVVSSAIVGVGSSERLSKVRWGVVGEIMAAWLITIPASMLLSAGIYWLLVDLIR